MADKKEKTIESKDKDGNVVKVLIKNPTAKQYRDSQVEYNKAFRVALDSGALLRQKINDHMIDQGIWGEEKEQKYQKFVDQINQNEELLKGGGVKLSDAKAAALKLRELRNDFKDLISERNSLDANSAEGQADNARFAELVRVCMINPDTGQPYFPDQQAYDSQTDQPWVVEASGELANMLYGLDPDYEGGLVENEFLKEFKFVNEDLRFINDDGHLVDSEGRLINEDSKYIAYRTEEGKKKQDPDEVYFVNIDGEEVISVNDDEGNETWIKKSIAERKPFLDDDGKPIITEQNEDKTSTKPKTTKRKTRAPKTDTKTV
jgi:soluble cytochrome b562